MQWVIEFAGISHALFIATFMCCKQPNHSSDKVLTLWMIVLSFPMLFPVLSQNIENVILSSLADVRCYPLTFGPFLLLYTRVLISESPNLKKTDLWHFVPFMVIATLHMTFPELYTPPLKKGAPPPSFLVSVDKVVIALSIISYFVYVLWVLRKHQLNVSEHFSFLASHITLKWLQWLAFGFIVISFIPAIYNEILRPLNVVLPIERRDLHELSYVLFIFVLSFFGLKQSHVFASPITKTALTPDQQLIFPSISSLMSQEEVQNRIDLTMPQLEQRVELSTVRSEDEKQNQKYERSGLNQERASDYLEKLEFFMQGQKPYLDGCLTIEHLAQKLNVPKHYLSQVINEHLGKNFYMYVNEYRINEVKKRLENPSQMSILEIAYESGFNSKSTFNTLFKQFTNQTPSQYRKSVSSKMLSN